MLGDLVIDYDRRRVTVAGRAVELTPTEYEVLRVLSAHAPRVLTYRSLLRRAWKRSPGRIDPKLVQAVMKRLRHKLREDAARPVYIHNERGVGYYMPPPGDG
ncbi:MAG: winged helix-turn-helix domain-containing protein [Gemmatimonadota bacterium]|nr:winged helix-turn-helix domain-containing protein [Gemmatimonadota bacterium]MDE2865300.1 winged helix-turn-helix domain-containing protein [Gemmatimonadota bacterium]